jgi:uncharacterized protein (DUF2126 family)
VSPFDFFVDDRCREVPFPYPDELAEELAPFLRGPAGETGPRVRALLAEQPARGYVTDHLVAKNALVARRVRYVIRDEPGIQTPEQTLEVGSESCRDTALLLCEALRAQGFAARFVSGYLVQLTDEGNIPDLARGESSDVVDLHAWCEEFVPGAGWIGLDGTSGLLCGEGHVPLASTASPAVAAPIDGTSSVAASAFEVRMEVRRLGHEPRPRRPYTEETWASIRAAGDAVDASLRASGLRLTMGGEPTWTSREHPRAPEWKEGAVGPTKWAQGLRLARALRARLAPGGVVLSKMGKHYPGESLPRWALELLWRADGTPLWRDPALLDFSVAAPGAVSRRGEAGDVEQAGAFAADLAAALGVPREHALPGYEDPWEHVLREQNLPDDVDPLRAGLDDPEARRTLARARGRGLGLPVGFALPLTIAPDAALRGERWASSPWTFRRGHLFLLCGDSPMGWRLPLDRLGGRPALRLDRDPSLPAPSLPAPAPVLQRPAGPGSRGLDVGAVAAPETSSSGPFHAPIAADDTVRTALCVEPRDGALHVFLPPLPSADAFVRSVAAIEAVAAARRRPVRLKGYGPPMDARMRHFVLTPDPGVLEVDVPPTESFAECTRLLETVADAANHAGLTMETYQLDGREVGTGGGHHLTLGSPTTAESPFLTRPALLAGLLRYVQNHPSLSFLFTGSFVGPTSQAPRVDEARDDALVEPELALARAERAGDAPPPWLVDRRVRNLLVDLTGNTHRTEICIDKLYDPCSPAGRHGLGELRAFQMPPHERMAVAQMLPVRSVVARLARAPFTAPRVRWGAELHDRFMLPHYLWAVFEDVVRDLRAHDLPLQASWWRPFLDVRYPVLGTLERDDIVLELRAALEPWHVLGEVPTATGTSRSVDSSLERIQVRVDGVTEGRHAVAVNGVAVPLRPTGRAAERVGGVRFRAGHPRSACTRRSASITRSGSISSTPGRAARSAPRPTT